MDQIDHRYWSISNVVYAAIDKNTGAYYAVAADHSGLWKWTRLQERNGTWNEILARDTSHSILSVAIDPATSNHLIVTDGVGDLNESTNGTSFNGWNARGSSTGRTSYLGTGDIPWLATYIGIYNPPVFFFDRSVLGQLDAVTGNDFWTVTPGTITTSKNITWQSQGRGIEQLVANEAKVPSSGAPVLAGWDHGIFAPDLTAYPSTFYPASSAVVAGWSIDFAASNPSFVAVLADGGYVNPIIGPQSSATSASYGAPGSWTAFPTLPSGIYGTSNGGNCCGDIAVSSSSTILIAPEGGVAPSYTTNCCSGKSTWTRIRISGIPDWSKFHPNFFHSGDRGICADTKNAGTFYSSIRLLAYIPHQIAAQIGRSSKRVARSPR